MKRANPNALRNRGSLSLQARRLSILLAFAVLPLTDNSTASSNSSESAPWEKERQLTDFQSLLKHSPFSLPTAEESSPLSERYALTGIITIGGEEQVFVFDRTDQSRELLGHKPNAKNMALLSILREGDAAKTKASIQVGGEIGSIGYLDATPQQAAQPMAQAPAGTPSPQGGSAGVRLPPLPKLPQQPSNTPPTRRIIRRPIVTPPQAQPASP
jgi:hypothetical protein